MEVHHNQIVLKKGDTLRLIGSMPMNEYTKCMNFYNQSK
jgi:hypothetical protein